MRLGEHEERHWGDFLVIHHQNTNKGEALTKVIKLKQGNNISYQFHNHREEVWTIIEGSGFFVNNEGIQQVNAGTTMFIPKGAWHSIKAISDLTFIEVQMGDKLLEEDIIRKYINWEDIMSHFEGGV